MLPPMSSSTFSEKLPLLGCSAGVISGNIEGRASITFWLIDTKMMDYRLAKSDMDWDKVVVDLRNASRNLCLCVMGF